MSTYTAARQSYLQDQVLAASPARLVTMLYDRLLLDLSRAEGAQELEDWAQARGHLIHAQRIVTELMTTLDVDAWDGGAQLHAIYAYALSTLLTASTTRDPGLIASVRELLEPIRSAWHEAATNLPALRSAAPNGSLGVA
ncbi:flagellar export chaperone FliS [Occultella gossypii]|uniref:Flagellar secretion chaperone FliS n=1 Tax=Occultella gossypii TaxID=2800820 RepID=A0ABS7S9G0_9MICO|nr:flagellar export chaperone FliS [Occultella gossypii]MBZ2196850.1 flagellar export chaperone FliS [Occultella gossypii]